MRKNNLKRYYLFLLFILYIYLYLFLPIKEIFTIYNSIRYFSRSKELYLLKNQKKSRSLCLLIDNYWTDNKCIRYPNSTEEVINYFKIENKDIFKSDFRKIFFKFIIENKDDDDLFNDRIIIYDPDSIYVFKDFYIGYNCYSVNERYYVKIDLNNNIYNNPNNYFINRILFYLKHYYFNYIDSILFYFKFYFYYFIFIVMFLSFTYWIYIYYCDKLNIINHNLQ